MPGFSGAAQAAELVVLPENDALLIFERDGQIEGLGADQAFDMLDRAGITCEVGMTQWSRVIGQAEQRPNTCVFTTAHPPARDAKFKWVGPLSEGCALLVRKADSDVAPALIEEARSYRTGTQTGDYAVDILEEAGFEAIDLAPTQDAGRNHCPLQMRPRLPLRASGVMRMRGKCGARGAVPVRVVVFDRGLSPRRVGLR